MKFPLISPIILYIPLNSFTLLSNPVIDELIAKTMHELQQAEKSPSDFRSWKSPQGYKFLVPWSNSVLVRILIRKLTETLPKSEFRSKAQIDDAARSTIANIEEGYKRATTQE